MSSITGTVKSGLVVLDDPACLPDGSRVVVQPVNDPQAFGLSESAWQDTPEAVADWIAWYDSLEPIEISAADEHAIADYRQRQKEPGASAFDAAGEIS